MTGIAPHSGAGTENADPRQTYPHLRIENLEIRRGERCLLQQFSASFPRGSFIAILGPSGCGKTSLLSCLAGMITPAQGSIEYRCSMGCPHSPQDFRHRTGVVFQHLSLTPNATARTNVLCGLLGNRPWWRTLFGFAASEKSKANGFLERLELGSYKDVPVSRISGGERQRVAIARALMNDPEFLLADEPVSHLDEGLARRIVEGLKNSGITNERSVICVLHDQSLAREFADFIISPDPERAGYWQCESVRE